MSPEGTLPSSIISLPQGGGALHGIGEKFSPDLFTGTGNFTVPIALPPGRNGFQPQLSLVYSSGNGNGLFGLGWSLDIPGVSRKTSDGVPRYSESNEKLPGPARRDVFIISGAEDLVPVDESDPKAVQYRPRTGGLFARIVRHLDGRDDYWSVESKDGLISTYGKPQDAAGAPAVIKKLNTSKIFSWKLTETKDPLGNVIRYEYGTDVGEKGGNSWNQPLLKFVRYVDYGGAADTRFLVQVEFEYDPEERPDPFSDYRAGFEIRTTRRCKSIKVSTHTIDGTTRTVREYRFIYRSDSYNGVSLLEQLEIIGYDDAELAYQDDDPQSAHKKQLPPLTFSYSSFAPEKRQFESVSGRDLPPRGLGSPDMELVDLHGGGLPDLLEMNGVVRYWRNLGNGNFDLPRPMQDAPPHSLAEPGVQMIDANGDGRADLLVTQGALSGYYSLQFDGLWNRRSFNKYQFAPSFNLKDPELRLLDLTGDGITDVLRSGTRFECFFNDPHEGWKNENTRWVERQSLEAFPNVSFSDARVRLADMTGDGLQDIALIHDGNVEYWPNLGHGDWGKRISMLHGPRFPYGYDPQRILIGDVDGDGLADIVYVDHDKVLLWLNHSGNSWSRDSIVIQGTPPSTSIDHLRLVDLYGSGVSGVLWSTEATNLSRQHLMFLDFTGGVKPYVLNQMDNNMGATTRVEYRPSTHYYLEDQKRLDTRWRTPLPFPVQLVARIEAIDQISHGKLTTEYKYHNGYWDGAEREFRGFGMVEQFDTEGFADYHASGLHGDVKAFKPILPRHFSQPTLTRTWFHQGPVGEEFGDWTEADFAGEYWSGDPQLLGHTEQVNAFLRRFNDRPGRSPSSRNRRIKRDALRTLRGSILRSELYALDGDTRLVGGEEIQTRPYTVTEHSYGLVEIAPPDAAARPRIFFPHPISQRTTQWERGNDPMTQFSYTDYRDEEDQFDLFGRSHRQTAVAMPRLTRNQARFTGTVVGAINPNETHVLAAHTRTFYATSPPDGYIHDRVSEVKTYELTNSPTGPDALQDSPQEALHKQFAAAYQLRELFDGLSVADVRLIGHQLNHYDGRDFEGLPIGALERRGALMRTETLVFTDRLLDEGYNDDNDQRRPDYLGGPASRPNATPASFDANIGYQQLSAISPRYESGHYADTMRRALSPRGVVTAIQDALKHETHIDLDLHELLPVQVTLPKRETDVENMKIQAINNYRVLQPASITEPNGNSTHVVYNPIGLPDRQFITGLDPQGNELGGTEATPEYKKAHEVTRTNAEISYKYDFMNFAHATRDASSSHPIFVHTRRRVQHARAANASDEVVESREYSDGFGRLIQTRSQAEEHLFGPTGDDVGLPIQPGAATAPATSISGSNRVVVSGWQVFDNKGKVVEKYEPFLGEGWNFQPDANPANSVHAKLFYDPRGQVIRTLNPDGSEQRVIFGAPIDSSRLEITPGDIIPSGFQPTPWERYTNDGNDLASVTQTSDGDALFDRALETHHFTPASVVLDGMGRTRCTVARNGADPANDWFITLSDYDIRGNLLAIKDALGREAFRYHYDLLNRVLCVDSIDAGRRTSVFNAQGNLIEYRDSKGSLLLRTYDQLNRPKDVWAQNDSADVFTLREQIHYGDESDHSLSRPHNTLNKPVKHYDEAGLLEMTEYDFKGNLLEKRRRTIRDELMAGEWRARWEDPNPNAALDPNTYQTNTTYDALNRPTELLYPQDVDGGRKKLIPLYDRAGALEAVQLDDESYVERIAYNAKGQRVLIAYGNGIMTRHAYDPQTFRLSRLRTERFTHPNDNELVFQPNGELLQDFSYHYDLVGNITTIDERVPHCGFTANPDAALVGDQVLAGLLRTGDALIRRFEYDPVYRLISATGRTCKDTSSPRGLGDDPRCGSYVGGQPTATQDNAHEITEGYVERYRYDAAGNMLELEHAPLGRTGWTRVFGIGGQPNISGQNASNNRLTSLNATAVPFNYEFDNNGNLTRQNTEREHTWDHADRMIAYRVQPKAAATPSVDVRYLYGADGMRVKKYVRNQQRQVNTTVYIDGVFEHHRQVNGIAIVENNTVHVMDNQSRIALVRVGAPLDARDASPVVAYHFGDHLGSSAVVVGGDNPRANAFINREEYFPYGETSSGSFAKKRYRFSGKERDEESGLYYFGARYYSAAIARWISVDPIFIERNRQSALGSQNDHTDRRNGYSYVENAPLVLIDPLGEAVAEKEVLNNMSSVLNTLQNVLRSPDQHGLLRGTAEAALTEAQGHTGVHPKTGQELSHLSQLRSHGAALNNNLKQFFETLKVLRNVNPGLAEELLDESKPIIEAAKSQRDLVRQTITLAEELEKNHGDRLNQIVYQTGSKSREFGTLVSQQLSTKGQTTLPASVAARSEVQGLMMRIRSLPINKEQLRNSTGSLTGAFTALRTAMASRAAFLGLAALAEMILAVGARMPSVLIYVHQDNTI